MHLCKNKCKKRQFISDRVVIIFVSYKSIRIKNCKTPRIGNFHLLNVTFVEFYFDLDYGRFCFNYIYFTSIHSSSYIYMYKYILFYLTV